MLLAVVVARLVCIPVTGELLTDRATMIRACVTKEGWEAGGLMEVLFCLGEAHTALVIVGGRQPSKIVKCELMDGRLSQLWSLPLQPLRKLGPTKGTLSKYLATERSVQPVGQLPQDASRDFGKVMDMAEYGLGPSNTITPLFIGRDEGTTHYHCGGSEVPFDSKRVSQSRFEFLLTLPPGSQLRKLGAERRRLGFGSFEFPETSFRMNSNQQYWYLAGRSDRSYLTDSAVGPKDVQLAGLASKRLLPSGQASTWSHVTVGAGKPFAPKPGTIGYTLRGYLSGGLPGGADEELAERSSMVVYGAHGTDTSIQFLDPDGKAVALEYYSLQNGLYERLGNIVGVAESRYLQGKDPASKKVELFPEG